ncbi:hypothetical protein HOY80DRAFT_966212 [Tuber brumale]|nr:hypothetical protein HOY80DRAFT_966212 [Tuber brumale]
MCFNIRNLPSFLCHISYRELDRRLLRFRCEPGTGFGAVYCFGITSTQYLYPWPYFCMLTVLAGALIFLLISGGSCISSFLAIYCTTIFRVACWCLY